MQKLELFFQGLSNWSGRLEAPFFHSKDMNMNLNRFYFFAFLLLTTVQAQYPILNEVLSFNTLTVKDEDGDYTDWIELYNPSNSSISLSNYFLSDDVKIPSKWVFPKITLPSGSFLLVYASGKDRRNGILHTNFKISSKGETLFLFSPTGQLLDSVSVPALAADQSYGRFSDRWSITATPTPGMPNSDPLSQLSHVVPDFSPASGFYAHPIEVSISVPEPFSIIFTMDGSLPHLGASIYQNRLKVTKTTVIRARVKDKEGRLGPVVTQSYFISPKLGLPVVSLSTHPANLFDADIGIYVEGNGTKLGGYPDNPVQPPANYWEDWERPVHIELFEPDGRLGFSIDAGVRMFGKTSRKLPQKSFAVFIRRAYGIEELHYPLFPDYPICRFKSFLLRNGGSDNTHNEGGVQFRDGLAARLLYGIDLEFQAYRPCHLYINGDYWGIYNLREKINEHYLAEHYGVDPDKIDLLDDYHRLYPLAVQGDATHFNALIDFLKGHSLSIQKNADYVAEIIDVKNYLTYMAVQIILANHDGPGHNCKFWRPNSEPGLYRWILYDVDHSFGLRLFVPN
ncbi:MAG: CotH kinase family protein, partial [candidate division KSB1 bacterium]|nr:CotH kinase family protein [candidate division KSB1 bacterium]